MVGLTQDKDESDEDSLLATLNNSSAIRDCCQQCKPFIWQDYSVLTVPCSPTPCGRQPATAAGVLVLAATNRPSVIDAALMRPGRLEVQLYVPPPDREGRLEVLKVHTTRIPLAGDVDLARLAADTEGFSGVQGWAHEQSGTGVCVAWWLGRQLSASLQAAMAQALSCTADAAPGMQHA